jgi:sn-glycerol 3-phosphate transport system substrate-binding protein
MPYISQSAAPVGGANLAIFKDIPAAQRQAAWQFVEWLTEPAQQARWAGLTGYLPVRRSCDDQHAVRAALEPAHHPQPKGRH